jgi:hypothetical protein
LKSGSSDYPLNLLKKAGVDMTSPQPIREALGVFAEMLAEMEQRRKRSKRKYKTGTACPGFFCVLLLCSVCCPFFGHIL